MNTTEVLQGLTFEQLRSQAERVRMRRLPPRTLQHWLSQIGIERDINGLYSTDDAEIIKALVRWLRRPGNTIEQFANQLREAFYAS